MKSTMHISLYLVIRFLRRSNKWSLALIIFLMAIAFINLVFVTSLFNGIIEASNNQVIDMQTGHIMMMPPDGADQISDVNVTLSKISAIRGIEAASPQTYVPGRITYKKITGAWQVIAMHPERERRVTHVSKKIITGSYLAENDTSGIILGRQIAGGEGVEMNAVSFRGARVGEKVTLTINNISKEFTIRGIYYTKFIDTDLRAFITQRALDEFVPFFKDTASFITIRVKKEKGVTEKDMVLKLKAAVAKAGFYTWKEVAGFMESVAESFVVINAVLTVVGMLIAAVTIFIVVYIDISSKRQQIGVLQAIGIKPYIIRTAYALQAFVYSICGIIIGGTIFFRLILPWFRAHPFEMPIGDAALLVNYTDFYVRAMVVLIVSVISGLIPSFIITRVKILDAIFNR